MAVKSPIQRDWEQREFIEMVSVNVKKITEFLNKFELSTRYRLARLNEKLTSLERSVEYLESAMLTTSGQDQSQQPQ